MYTVLPFRVINYILEHITIDITEESPFYKFKLDKWGKVWSYKNIICYKMISYTNLKALKIFGIFSFNKIFITKGLKRLIIDGYNGISKIPIIEGLRYLEIYGHNTISKVPYMEGLKCLYIGEHNGISKIPIIEGLKLNIFFISNKKCIV
jgi:hypothetical protein